VLEDVGRDLCHCHRGGRLWGSPPSTYTLGNEGFLSPRVKRSERECDRLPPIGGFVKDTSNCKSAPPYLCDNVVLKQVREELYFRQINSCYNYV